MKHKPLLTYVTLLLLLLSRLVIADSASTLSEFEVYKRQSQQGVQAYKNEFEQYRQELLNAFAIYKKKTALVWGKDNVMPDKNNWVSYQNDTSQRSIVDFEKGTVNVEVALPVNTNISDKEIRNGLKDNIVTLLNQREDTRTIPEMARQPAIKPGWSPNSNKKPPVLNRLVADNKGIDVKPQDYEALATKLANNARKKTIRGDDGKRRIVYDAQFRLVPDHIKRLAKKYQHQVNVNASQQQLKPELVFSIIETESWFNPTARSAAPAFGLMQLVPTSGARDAYKYLYNKDKIVTESYLYKPDNNIKLGSAYLSLLYYKYFKGIKSSESRQWATIAAYNTGPGNVFRTFAGKYHRSRFGTRDKWKQTALYEINRRTPEQVYRYMRNSLPYDETRGYIKKVRTKMKKYTKS